jgi:lipopolysaccharide export system permease protein
MKILYRYILLELAGPFFLSLSLLTFILFMRQLLFLFPKIIGKNLDWPVIGELLLLILPFILALVLPMAVLVATIMSFGRLSSDNEITAFKALGVPLHRILASPLAAAFLLMLGAIWFNDRVLPESNHRYKNLLLDITYLKPTLTLREGVIMDDFPGMGLMVNTIKNPAGKRNLTLTAPDNSPPELGEGLNGPAELFGIIITQNISSTRRTIIADSGLIRFTPDRNNAVLTLFHGEIQEVDPQRQEKFQRLFFNRHQILLPDVGSRFQRGRAASYRGDREMSLKMIKDNIHHYQNDIDSIYRTAAFLVDSIPSGDSTTAALKRLIGKSVKYNLSRLKKISPLLLSLNKNRLAQPLTDPLMRLTSLLREAGFLERRIASLRVEYWKKISIPFASLVFVLLGASLGIFARRGGAGVSIAISMGVFLVYWVFLISGETLADRMMISPFWAMWSANAVFLALGVWLLVLQIQGRFSVPVEVRGFAFKIPEKLRKIFSRRSANLKDREHEI